MIHGGAVTEVINVYQTGGGIILLTESDVCVSDRGEIVAVEIKSNCEFEVKMPDVDWITVANARSVSSHTLYYTVSPNETYDGREAEIVFLDKKNSNVSDTLCIRQVQKDAILLSEMNIQLVQTAVLLTLFYRLILSIVIQSQKLHQIGLLPINLER